MIFVVSHKNVPILSGLPEGYAPLFVGPSRTKLAEQLPGSFTDDTGDSISELNPFFCELTAMYWAWKNIHADVKGIVHYRRFFTEENRAGGAEAFTSPIPNESVKQILESYDCIVPTPRPLLQRVGDDYARHHEAADMGLLKEAIAKQCPEYLPQFDYCMRSRYIFPYNMLIAREEVYDSYCAWLFPLLFNVYENTDLISRDVYERRAIGFLSERLLGVWLPLSAYRWKELPVAIPEMSLKEHISMELARITAAPTPPILPNISHTSSADAHSFSKEPHVWGGIVTYNPDIARLRENVQAIAPQVEQLLIFDNASDNIAAIKGAGFPARIIESESNLGMSKALNRMADLAIQEGATDIVFLDQDSVAAEGFVEAEVEQRGAAVGIVCPLIVDRNVEKADVDKSLVLDAKHTVTSGSMVNLTAWSRVCGYDERLFVDWVDNEFCDNLRTHGYRIVRTHKAEILHEMGHQEYAWSGPGRDYANNNRAAKAYYRRNYPAWRWKDTGRGEAIAIYKYQRTEIGNEERINFLRTLGRIVLIENNKVLNLRAALAGYSEGRKTMEREDINRARSNEGGESER